jgi:riboflavin synthase
MFTGIVEAVGRVASVQPRQGDLRLQIATGDLDLGDVALGDSIATNGVCLTVSELSGNGFWADLSVETLQHSTLRDVAVGTAVNLERALLASSRLGGHIVSGHVDGVGQVMARQELARALCFTIAAPEHLARYISHKGSICVDGVSLTVNAVRGAEFDLTLVPHTVKETIICSYRVGSRVNLEVDLIARYLERLLLGEKAAQAGYSGKADAGGKANNPEAGLSLAFLAKHGFR